MRFGAWLRRETDGLCNLLLPPACAFCLERLSPPDPDNFCPSCHDKILPISGPSCRRCALPFQATDGDDHYCQTCLTEKRPLFSGVTPVGHHDTLLREAIHRLKYRNDISLARPLAHLLTSRLRDENSNFDLILPVPLHRSRLHERGYNQSVLLARQLGRRLQLPVELNRLQRILPGPPQQGLSARERSRNVRNHFKTASPLNGEAVLLVDDVMTTGATARECARTLMKNGAGSIHVAILARAALQ